LEKLEDEHVSLLAERYDMIAKRRRDDDEDDLSLFLYLPLVRPNASEDETDEYGRSVESRPEGPHSSSRESRRASRAARRSAIHPSSVSAPYKLALSTEDELGYITDSALLPSDLEDYTLAREKLAHKVSTLLEDVRSDEFRDPRAGYGLAKRFSEWREKFSDSYTGAWGGLGLVGAWEFWARLEIVDWNPLEVCCWCGWYPHRNGRSTLLASRNHGPSTHTTGIPAFTNIRAHRPQRTAQWKLTDFLGKPI
jgi:GC-rich sequence DNA-binding factor